jgi:hypothetical protein
MEQAGVTIETIRENWEAQHWVIYSCTDALREALKRIDYKEHADGISTMDSDNLLGVKWQNNLSDQQGIVTVNRLGPTACNDITTVWCTNVRPDTLLNEYAFYQNPDCIVAAFGDNSSMRKASSMTSEQLTSLEDFFWSVKKQLLDISQIHDV